MFFYVDRPIKDKNKTPFIQNPKLKIWPQKNPNYLRVGKSSKLKMKYFEKKLKLRIKKKKFQLFYT
jgi:hypothetical protein